MSIEIMNKVYPYLLHLIKDDMDNKKTTNANAIVELLKMIK